MSIIKWNELRNFPRRNLDLRASTELAKVEAFRHIAEELHLIRRHLEAFGVKSASVSLFEPEDLPEHGRGARGDGG